MSGRRQPERKTVANDERRKQLALVTRQGDLTTISFTKNSSSRSLKGGGLRNPIFTFSRASRKRLLHLFARLQTHRVRTVFLTLTFHDQDDAKAAKQTFRAFRERLRRRFPKSSFIWRMERQERGAIHFHLILFNFPYVPQSDLQTWWTETTGEDLSIVHIKLLRGKKRAFYYCSKYCAKTNDESTSFITSTYPHADRWEGRFWGIQHYDQLPFASKKSWFTDDLDAALYFRYWLLKSAKVGYSPSRYSNFACMEFGGVGGFGFANSSFYPVATELQNLPNTVTIGN